MRSNHHPLCVCERCEAEQLLGGLLVLVGLVVGACVLIAVVVYRT